MIEYQLSATNQLKKWIKNLCLLISEGYYRTFCRDYDFCGYDRIYFYHIPKTGGTSIIHMFLSLGGVDPAFLYQRLIKKNRVLTNGKIFVGWNSRLINRGNYFFAFSHQPWHRLSLPKKTFTITCFRDPIDRVLSNYNMLMYLKTNNIPHPGMKMAGTYLGRSFDDFLMRAPKSYLLSQLYMFSEEFKIDQALERVEKISHVFFTKQFQDSAFVLSQRLGIILAPLHIRKARYQTEITPSQRLRLLAILDEEIEFVNRISENSRDFSVVNPGS